MCLIEIIFTITKVNATVSPILRPHHTEQSNFNIIILSDAHLRIYSTELQKPGEGKGFPPYFNKEHPFLIEIQKANRKFVLAAKSHFDLEEWCRAI